jgi:hypothetical protein
LRKIAPFNTQTFHTEENDRERFDLPIVSALLGSLLELRRVSLARARARKMRVKWSAARAAALKRKGSIPEQMGGPNIALE